MKRIITFSILVLIAGAGLYWRLSRPTLFHLVPKPTQTSYSVAILGDSLVAGEGASSPDTSLPNLLLTGIKAQQPNATMLSTGVNGATVQDVYTTQLPQLSGKTYDLIFVVVGANDVTHLTPRDTFSTTMNNVLDKLTVAGQEVVLLNVPKLADTPIVPEGIRLFADQRTRDFNSDIAAAVKGRARVHLFDFYALSGSQLAKNSDLISADGFHPNDKGYQMIADALAAAVL